MDTNRKTHNQVTLLDIQAHLLNLSNEAIFAYDLNGIIIYWNEGAEKKYGFSNEEAIGCVSHDLLNTVFPGDIKDIKTILEKDGAWIGEIQQICKDGRKLIIESKQQVILNELGQPIILETNRDITARKRAEEKANWNKLRAEILWEVAGKLLSNNKSQEMIKELCSKVMEFLGCHAFLNYLVDDEKQRLHLNAYSGISEDTAEEIEWLDFGSGICGCVGRTGSKKVAEKIQISTDMRISLENLFGIKAYACHQLMEHHKVIGTLTFGSRTKDSFNEDELSIMKAVADQVAVAMNRIRMEQKLIQVEKEKNDALKRAIEMKDEFLSLVSHEFKTPITVINSAIQAMEVICKNELTDKAKGFLNKIRQNSYRQLRLVNSLLDITRVSSGHIKLNKKNVDIVFITRSITESVQLYAHQKGVKLTFVSTIGSRIIEMDEEKYERILLNLLSNAIKFTPKGKAITVKTSMKTVKGKLNVSIEVKDHGIGIPNDKIELIFERFGQVDSSLSRQAEGTGIGLSLVKMLVESLNGIITVKSKVEKGSTFTVLFPAVKLSECPIEEMLQEINDNWLVQATAVEFSDIYF